MRNVMTAAIFLGGIATMPATAMAQSAVEGRVDRLEGEMRAVQRKVFPGGSGQLIEPDISARSATSASGVPSGSPVTDLTARVDALESQLSTLTGQIEQLQFKQRQFDDAYAAGKRSTDARLKALEDTTSSTGGTTTSVDTGAPVTTLKPVTPKPVTTTPKPATTGTATAPAKDTPTAVSKDPARAKLVAAVEKPVSDDPAEDAYSYGFRLWQAKFYPEAEAQLRGVVKDYPKHRRASYSQNLLGRAYLDEGKPNLAVLAFYDNYRKMPDGERAPDSLYYLAQALVKLNKPASEVCKVYGELTDVYADKMSEQMKADVARGRASSKCK